MEVWDGSSWTEVANLNVAKTGVSAVGTSTAAQSAGGSPPVSATTEIYDGITWTEVGDLNTARYTIQGGGTSTLSFAGGGYTSTHVVSTEEWSIPQNVKVITD